MMKSNEAINKANKGLIEAEKRIEDIKEKTYFLEQYFASTIELL